MDVHPFTFDEFAQAFHDKVKFLLNLPEIGIICCIFLLFKCDLQDSSLLGKVHVSLLKLLMLNTERGSGSVFVPRSSKDSRFLSFLNFVSFEMCCTL